MSDLSLYQFKADLQKFAQQIDASLELVIQKIALDLWAKVIKKTPVDTGRARSGWALTIGEPDIVSAPEKVQSAGSTVQYQAPATPNVSGIDGTLAVYILNNVSYIEALEDGHSKQAPAGMVRLSLAEVELEIESMML